MLLRIASEVFSSIQHRHAKATKGPWTWRTNVGTKSINLMSVVSPRSVVLAFRRWGTRFAAPAFNVKGILYTVAEMLEQAMPPSNYREMVEFNREHLGLGEHPDATFIEHSWEDVGALLGEVQAGQALIQALAEALCVDALWVEMEGHGIQREFQPKMLLAGGGETARRPLMARAHTLGGGPTQCEQFLDALGLKRTSPWVSVAGGWWIAPLTRQ